MPGAQEESELRHVIGVLRRRGWVIVLLVALAAAGAFAYAKRQPSEYEATAKVRISTASSVFSTNGQNVDPKRLVDTETQVVQSNDLRVAVNAQMGADAALVGAMEVTNPTGTDVLAITVRSTSPEVARDAANAFANTYVTTRVSQRVDDLTTRATELRKQSDDLAARISALPANDPGRSGLQSSQNNFTNLAAQNETDAAVIKANGLVVATAQTPASPVSPKPLRDTSFAALIALLVGIAVVFILERTDDSLRGTAAFDGGDIDGPLLGTLPISSLSLRLPLQGRSGSPALVPLGSSSAEPYRTIVSNIRFSNMGRGKRVLLVTSPTHGEGASTVVANVAVAMAQDGLRVVVVSADLRTPTIGQAFGIDDTSRPGLSDLLAGGAVELVQFKTESQDLLDVMPSGSVASNPAGLLGSTRMAEFVEHLRSEGADYVLIDSAPIMEVGDSRALVGIADGVVLVTRQGQSSVTELREAIALLRTFDAALVGVLLNGVKG